MKLLISILASAVVLISCGGGGGAPECGGSIGSTASATSCSTPMPTISEAQGLYTGSDSANDEFTGVILDSGTFYMVYTNASGAIGLVEGTSTANGGNFQSNDAKEFSFSSAQVLNGTVKGRYSAKSGIDGSITPNGPTSAPITYSGTYGMLYDAPASTGLLAGSYTGAATAIKGADNVTFTVGGGGSISGQGQSGCTFGGIATPHKSTGVFDITIKFAGTTCLYDQQTFSGIAVNQGNEIVAAILKPDRTDAFLIAAYK